MVVFFFKQKTAYERRISDWSSDVCSSDLVDAVTGTNDRSAPRTRVSAGLDIAVGARDVNLIPGESDLLPRHRPARFGDYGIIRLRSLPQHVRAADAMSTARKSVE